MLPEELKIGQSIRTEFAPKWDKIVTYLTIGRGLWRDINLFQFNAADRTVSYSAEHLANLRVGTLSSQEMQTVFDVNKYVSDLTRIRPHDITSTADIYRFDLEAFYGSLRHKPDYKYWACRK